MKTPSPFLRRACAAMLLVATSLSIANPAGAQDSVAPAQVFIPVQVPADWQAHRFSGIDLSLPAGLTLLKDRRDARIWGQGDEATKSAFGLGLEFEDSPETMLKREKAVPDGSVVLPNGQTFGRYVLQTPAKVAASGQAELLVSDLPLRGEDRLIVSLMVMNRDIGPYRDMFQKFLSSLALPEPGKMLQRDLLGGVLRWPVGPEWGGVRNPESESVYMYSDDLDGRIWLNRGAVNTGSMRRGTPGNPVLFLGQKAQLFAHEEGSETKDDGSGAVGQTRLIVLETCLPGNEVISVRFSGMPSMFRDPRVLSLMDGAEIVMPDGSAPCPAGALPDGAQLQADARPEVTPPFDLAATAAPVKRVFGQVLDGLYTIDFPGNWSLTPEAGGHRVRLENTDGTASIAVARGTAFLGAEGPAAGVPLGTWHKPGIALGWPSEVFEWEEGGRLHRLHVHAHCLAGGERFGMLVSGDRLFHDDGEFSRLSKGLVLNMPDDVRPCDDPAEGIGTATAEVSAPEENAKDIENKEEKTNVATGEDTDWYGKSPLSTLPSPATESLAGRLATSTPARTKENPNENKRKADVSLPPPPPPASPAQVVDRDRFIPQQGGYSLYQNDRYGTFISFPSNYFHADPAPDSGDGRLFRSVDETARFYVFAQYNAEGLSQSGQIARDKENPAYGSITYERSGRGWYVLSGVTGAEIFYRRVTEDRTGLIRVFEIAYPLARKEEFDALVTYMAQSFGPPPDQ
ncbi:hypothetical protein [Thalassovita sp.]|uniref:hypothetical protein n=1 Tax=Thalassovita sp. TaxID=1979401 RepID=UPI0029DE8C6B|nr:hypothetical protein [Thalassovita sp.]